MQKDFEIKIEEIKKSTKICIFGCPGSGKSTLCKELCAILKLDSYHLDNIYWKPNWVSISKEEFDTKLEEIMRKDIWIIDGNYNRTLDQRLEKSEFIIYLDMNKFTCLSSAIKRYFKYKNKSRDDITEGCPEVLDKEFISYIWNFNKNHRKKYYQKLNDINKPYLILKSRKDVERLLKALKN